MRSIGGRWKRDGLGGGLVQVQVTVATRALYNMLSWLVVEIVSPVMARHVWRFHNQLGQLGDMASVPDLSVGHHI